MMRNHRYPPPHRRRKAHPLANAIPGTLRRPPATTCPNEPPCQHASMFHDVEDMDGSGAACTVDGCTCGKAPGTPAFIRDELIAILDGCPEASGTEWPFVRDTCLVPHLLDWLVRHSPEAGAVALSAFAQHCRHEADRCYDRNAPNPDGVSQYWRFAQQKAEAEVTRLNWAALPPPGEESTDGRAGLD